MRVLIVTHGTCLYLDRIASGNTVRAYNLTRGLAEHGVEVIQAVPEALSFASGSQPLLPKGARLRSFTDRADFQRLLARTRPDLLLVGYWRLLELVPEHCDVPVVLDFVAPRMLEAPFQGEVAALTEARHMLGFFRHVDRFLCGTERQKHLLVGWLLLAGLDCVPLPPIDVIPISGTPTHGRRQRRSRPFRIVTGGFDWPWRHSKRYVDAARSACDKAGLDAVLLSFFGQYVYQRADPRLALGAVSVQATSSGFVRLPLLAYGDMDRFFREQCHLGLELAEENLERRYSCSFRSIDWLRNGMPIICNDYLELAELVREHEAGWVVSAPAELVAIFRKLREDSRVWARKSRGALELVDQHFHYRKTIVPLIRFLRAPSRPKRTSSILDLDQGLPERSRQ